jgi:hypothetical protein
MDVWGAENVEMALRVCILQINTNKILSRKIFLRVGCVALLCT